MTAVAIDTSGRQPASRGALRTPRLAILIGATVEEVQAVHEARLDEWACKHQLRDHLNLVVLDADLNRIRRCS